MRFRDLGRFWKKVNRSGGPAACWPWRAHTTQDGHGRIKIDGRMVAAHRLAYWLAGNGDFPTGLVVRHLCNNPGCCNPAHLAVGTHADNVADRCAAGRSARGEGHGKHKLTWAAVHDIRARAATGTVDPTALAHEYGVTRRAIELVLSGRNWREETC
jgi:hypothetical protein